MVETRRTLSGWIYSRLHGPAFMLTRRGCSASVEACEACSKRCVRCDERGVWQSPLQMGGVVLTPVGSAGGGCRDIVWLVHTVATVIVTGGLCLLLLWGMKKCAGWYSNGAITSSGRRVSAVTNATERAGVERSTCCHAHGIRGLLLCIYRKD